MFITHLLRTPCVCVTVMQWYGRLRKLQTEVHPEPWFVSKFSWQSAHVLVFFLPLYVSFWHFATTPCSSHYIDIFSGSNLSLRGLWLNKSRFMFHCGISQLLSLNLVTLTFFLVAIWLIFRRPVAKINPSSYGYFYSFLTLSFWRSIFWQVKNWPINYTY